MSTLKVEYKKPFSINPMDKYKICKYPAHTVMNEKSYTLFTKVLIHADEIPQDDAGILVRPGMHSGFSFTKPNYLKFGFWFDFKDKEPFYSEICYGLNEEEISNFLSLVVIDNVEQRNMKVYLNKKEIGVLYYPENSTKHGYTNTHYYFGVSNPYIIARPYDQYGSFTFGESGLLDVAIDNIDILDNIQNNIVKHPRLGYNIFDDNYELKKNFVFYYDFIDVSNYKIWDVSENNNFLCKILDRDNNIF